MKSMLSVFVAAVFAASGFNAVAQSKPVDTKGGGAVKSKDGLFVSAEGGTPQSGLF